MSATLGAGAATGGSGAASDLAAGGGASTSRGTVLFASSSAMMRRMEARISSIDGSCDFAGCVMRLPSPQALPKPAFRRAYRRESRKRNYPTMQVSGEYVMPKDEGNHRLCIADADERRRGNRPPPR